MSNNVTKIPDRRQQPTSRRQTTGETTAFDLSSIQAARKREEQLEPMFLVCRGVQKGRPIPIQSGNWTIGRGPLCDVSVQGRGISRTHVRLEHSDERQATHLIDEATLKGGQ